MPCKCPPADMLTLYSYLHGKQIDETEQKIKKMIDKC